MPVTKHEMRGPERVVSLQILEQFLTGKASQRFVGLVNPLLFSDDPTPSSSPVSSKAPKSVSKPGVSSPASGSRIKDYALQRNSADSNSSSRMSPYLASGVVSARMVLNKAKNMGKGQKLESGRDTGIGMWVQEVAWRDFYNHVSRDRSGMVFRSPDAHRPTILLVSLQRSWLHSPEYRWEDRILKRWPTFSGRRVKSICRLGKMARRGSQLLMRCV